MENKKDLSSFFAKLLKAWDEIETVFETWNKDQKYGYPPYKVMVGMVRKACVKGGVFIHTETVSEAPGIEVTTSSGKTGRYHAVELRMTLTDGTDQISSTFKGQALAFGDKGMSSAYTMAFKQGLKIMFMVDSAEDKDPDGDTSQALPDIDFTKYPIPDDLKKWFIRNEHEEKMELICSQAKFRMKSGYEPNYTAIGQEQKREDEKLAKRNTAPKDNGVENDSNQT